MQGKHAYVINIAHKDWPTAIHRYDIIMAHTLLEALNKAKEIKLPRCYYFAGVELA